MVRRVSDSDRKALAVHERALLGRLGELLQGIGGPPGPGDGVCHRAKAPSAPEACSRCSSSGNTPPELLDREAAFHLAELVAREPEVRPRLVEIEVYKEPLGVA